MIKIVSTYSCFGINHEVYTWLFHGTYYDIGKKNGLYGSKKKGRNEI